VEQLASAIRGRDGHRVDQPPS